MPSRNDGLTIVTSASASISARAFLSAVSPPPTTRQGRPRTSRNMGRYPIARIQSILIYDGGVRQAEQGAAISSVMAALISKGEGEMDGAVLSRDQSDQGHRSLRKTGSRRNGRREESRTSRTRSARYRRWNALRGYGRIGVAPHVLHAVS